MTKSTLLKEEIGSGVYDEIIINLYEDASLLKYQKQRYINSINRYEEIFGVGEVEIYSAPGRSEVCGNHTDHQNGKVLATSINLDAIAVVSKNKTNKVQIFSEGYSKISIDIDELSKKEEEEGLSISLIRGILAYIVEAGYLLEGFDLYTTSDVLVGAGMSSSAAFEVLIGTVISGVFNHMSIDPIMIAKASQYSEKIYFGKPCGLMDQMACSVGGLIGIDFKDSTKPQVTKINMDFSKHNISLCLIDTLGSHEDLTEEYSLIPYEMTEIASFFGKSLLREVDEKTFYERIPALREKYSDRPVLRAIHFFEEEHRVDKAISALLEDNMELFFKCIRSSGNSSYQYLQNVYSTKQIEHQNIPIALALSEKFLDGALALRVHGGGFAGTIQVFIQDKNVNEYKKYIEAIFGKDTCHVLKIRKCGGIKVIG